MSYRKIKCGSCMKCGVPNRPGMGCGTNQFPLQQSPWREQQESSYYEAKAWPTLDNLVTEEMHQKMKMKLSIEMTRQKIEALKKELSKKEQDLSGVESLARSLEEASRQEVTPVPELEQRIDRLEIMMAKLSEALVEVRDVLRGKVHEATKPMQVCENPDFSQK